MFVILASAQEVTPDISQPITIGLAVSLFIYVLSQLLQRLAPAISDLFSNKVKVDVQRDGLDIEERRREGDFSQRAKEQILLIAQEHINNVAKTQSQEIKDLREKHEMLFLQYAEIRASEAIKDQIMARMQKDFDDDREEMRKSVKISNAKIRKMHDQIISLRQELDEISRKSNELEKINAILENSLNEHRQELKNKDGLIKALRERVKVLENQLNEIKKNGSGI